MEDTLRNVISESVHQGILLGLMEATISLEKLIEIKVNDGYGGYITKSELNTFMNTYIECKKAEYNL